MHQNFKNVSCFMSAYIVVPAVVPALVGLKYIHRKYSCIDYLTRLRVDLLGLD